MKQKNIEKKKSGCLKKVLLTIIFICLLPLSPLLILPAIIGIWYYSKRKPNTKCRNISIALTIIGVLTAYSLAQSPTNHVKNVNTTSVSSSKQVTSSSSSTSSSKKKEDEKKKKDEERKKQEEAKKAEETRKVAEAQKLLENAENSVKKLEDNQILENIASAEDSVAKVTDSTKRPELQRRIELIKNAINQRAEEAKKQEQGEQAVQALENNQVTENIAPAQEAINQITDPGKKQELQRRVGLVQDAINQRAAEAEAQRQQAAAAAQAAQQPAASYRNCREAKAAGAAPLYRGQPGYAPHLDRDGDGIACER